MVEEKSWPIVEKYKYSGPEEYVHKQIFPDGVHKTIGSELVKGKIEPLFLVFLGVNCHSS